MEFIDYVVDTLIHSLDPAVNLHLTPQFFCLIFTYQACYLIYELIRFFRSDKFGGLNSINQELELSHLKGPCAHVVIIAAAFLVQNDVDAKIP